MLQNLSSISSALLLAMSSPTIAQSPIQLVEAPLSITQETSFLRAGAPVPLKMSETLTTKGKKLKVGQRFQMEVAQDVVLNNQVVIPAGSPATGEVTEVRNKGMWGKSGRINARVLFVRVDGRQIRLTGQIDDKGVTGTAGVVGALVVVPVAGFFVTGTSAVIPIDTPVNAFLDEDVAVAFSEPAPIQATPLEDHAPAVSSTPNVPELSTTTPTPATAAVVPGDE